MGGGVGGGTGDDEAELLPVLSFQLECCLCCILGSFSSSSIIVVVVEGDFCRGCDGRGIDRVGVLSFSSSGVTKLLRNGLLEPMLAITICCSLQYQR